jgi:hypothetical protein
VNFFSSFTSGSDIPEDTIFQWYWFYIIIHSWKTMKTKTPLTMKATSWIPFCSYLTISKMESRRVPTSIPNTILTSMDVAGSSGYSCECGRIYRYKQSLSLHRRLECGKEPSYRCTLCPKSFHQRGNLVRHVRVKHRPFIDPMRLCLPNITIIPN